MTNVFGEWQKLFADALASVMDGRNKIRFLRRRLRLILPTYLLSLLDTLCSTFCRAECGIQVPEYLMKLLEEVNASPGEKADVVELYAIAGLHAAINFVEGLPLLRSRAVNSKSHTPV